MGDGTGENLHGLIPQATSFNTGLLPGAASGWNRIDIVGAAIEQVDAANEVPPTFVAVHPTDWWKMRLTKDGFGRYILGDPQTQVRPSIFGLDVVATTSMPVGAFLVGSGSPAAAEIRDRMGMQVEISSEHADFFVRNLIAVRCEKRLALLTKRPASFVAGSFVTSNLVSQAGTTRGAGQTRLAPQFATMKGAAMEHRDFNFKVKAAGDQGGQGTFSGLAATYDLDQGGYHRARCFHANSAER